MSFPSFFDQVPTITMFDPLTRFLGAGDGTITYRYEEAAKLAGHSCPTVAGAWLMLRAGLARLWPEGIPARGSIRVHLPEDEDEGTTGVVASIASLITGARGIDGFKGIAGQFARRDLLHFGVPLPGAMGLERTDTGTRVAVRFNPTCVPSQPEMRALLQKWAERHANGEEVARLGELWQDRVRRILVERADDPEMVQVVDWA